MITLGDYISPGLRTVWPDFAFPNILIGDTGKCQWRYLRREIGHNWYVDRRAPSIGFLSRDEAHILYNNALQFRGQRALEIGCWMGWSTCHLALAGVELDVIDPLLERAEVYASVANSLSVAGVSNIVTLVGGVSPQKVHEVAARNDSQWSLIFIDGNHAAPFPLNDAIACEPYAASDAMILFHDLTAPDVTQGLDFLQQTGWKTMLYQTMQIMGVAWRGNVQPAPHIPDPSIAWDLPAHLRRHPVSGWRADFNPEQARTEIRGLLQRVHGFTLLSERRLTALYTLARDLCQRDVPGNFVECGTYKGGAAAMLAHVIKSYSRRPRRIYCCDSFAGMPEPTSFDTHQGVSANQTRFGAGTLKAPLEEGLDEICRRLQVRDVVTPVPGWFADTLPKMKDEFGAIALLHADGDWYTSTLDIFRNLFDSVTPGGMIQIDDYGYWVGCRKAVHQFEEERRLSFLLNPIDDTGVWLRKE